MEAATNGTIESRFAPDGESSLEGLLFPDTYQISNADNEAQVVERMSALMERVANDQEDLEVGAYKMRRSAYDLLIVASMIEKEAKLDEDRPKIASVIYNRLKKDMRLEMDSTVKYVAPESEGVYVTKEEMAIDSPYNTYLVEGLPPGPIANPGLASLQAVAQPQPSDFIYFVADCGQPGAHTFAVTYEEHLQNVERCR